MQPYGPAIKDALPNLVGITVVNKQLERAAEKWDRFSEKVMLQQRDEIMIRPNLLGP